MVSMPISTSGSSSSPIASVRVAIAHIDAAAVTGAMRNELAGPVDAEEKHFAVGEFGHVDHARVGGVEDEAPLQHDVDLCAQRGENTFVGVEHVVGRQPAASSRLVTTPTWQRS